MTGTDQMTAKEICAGNRAEMEENMRFGCCISMNAEDEIGEKRIRFLADAGYDYFEAPMVSLMNLSGEQIEKLLSVIGECKIGCECANVFFPGTLRLTGETVNREQFEDYVTKALALAGRLGVKIVVFGSAGAKNIPEGFPYEKAYEQLVDELKFIDREAVRNGVTIAIEPLNRKESNFIVSLKEGHELVHAADFSNIRLLADFYHFNREKDELRWLTDYKEDLVHIHIANPSDRTFPTKPLPEFDEFFAELKKAGYAARVSVEAGTKDFEADAKEFIRMARERYS